jgi:hypothetical protein
LMNLVQAMAGLAAVIAELHAAHQRLHQAHTARSAADLLTGYTPPPPQSRAPSPRTATPTVEERVRSQRNTQQPSRPRSR